MSLNSFGHMYKVTTWGESHGPSLGATIDGCPPGIEIDQNKLQVWMDKRKPGQTKYTTQRNEADSCLLYTSPSPRDVEESRMPSSA